MPPKKTKVKRESICHLFQGIVQPSPPIPIREFRDQGAEAIKQTCRDLQIARQSVNWESERPELLRCIEKLQRNYDNVDGQGSESSAGRPEWYLQEAELYHYIQQEIIHNVKARSMRSHSPPPPEARSTLQQLLLKFKEIVERHNIGCTSEAFIQSAPPEIVGEGNAILNAPPDETSPLISGVGESASRPPAGYDVIITFSFHDPLDPSRRLQEVELSCDNSLRDLRDILVCPFDFLVPTQKLNSLVGPKRSASIFFIEDTFYVDDRSHLEENVFPMMQWYFDQKKGSRRGYDDTPLKNLTLRVNAPYVLIHQEDCQHLILVQNIRLQAKGDLNFIPRTTFQCIFQRSRCSICQKRPMRYTTWGDRLSGDNPCRWCDQCYRSFHYSQNGELLYDDYTIYEYVTPS